MCQTSHTCRAEWRPLSRPDCRPGSAAGGHWSTWEVCPSQRRRRTLAVQREREHRLLFSWIHPQPILPSLRLPATPNAQKKSVWKETWQCLVTTSGGDAPVCMLLVFRLQPILAGPCQRSPPKTGSQRPLTRRKNGVERTWQCLVTTSGGDAPVCMLLVFPTPARPCWPMPALHPKDRERPNILLVWSESPSPPEC